MAVKPDKAIMDSAASSLRPEDVCNIQFTSGTTGRPKAAALTHIGLLNNAKYAAERMRFGPEDNLSIPCSAAVFFFLQKLKFIKYLIPPIPAPSQPVGGSKVTIRYSPDQNV